MRILKAEDIGLEDEDIRLPLAIMLSVLNTQLRGPQTAGLKSDSACRLEYVSTQCFSFTFWSFGVLIFGRSVFDFS